MNKTKNLEKLEEAEVILLDLNFTLVENSDEKKSPFTEKIKIERYREWLIELLQDKEVILITARPDKYLELTLQSIKEKTDWLPKAAYFNEVDSWPPVAKEHILKTYLQETLNTKKIVAIESNPRTRHMYARYNIPCYKVAGDGIELTDELSTI